MGTRSTITFCGKVDNEIIPYVNIYQQYDGYLDGVGVELCRWLNNKIMVNGISSRENRNIANGVGCLAAQYISENKHEIGGLYIYPIGDAHKNCDYNYQVIIDEEAVDVFEDKKMKDITIIVIDNFGREPFFTGTISQFFNYLNEIQKEI